MQSLLVRGRRFCFSGAPLYRRQGHPPPSRPSSAYYASSADIVPDFEASRKDTEHLLASQPTSALLRSIFVLWSCSVPFLVRHSQQFLDFSVRVLGQDFTHALVRSTIFAQFVAGESASAIRPVVKQLDQQGIRCILDYAAEANLGRHHDISDEEADRNVEFFLKSIDAAAESLPHKDACVALKVTALGRSELLERVTEVLRSVRDLFSKFNAPTLNEKKFIEGLTNLGVGIGETTAASLFKRFDSTGKGEIELLDWIDYLTPEDWLTRPFFTAPRSGSEKSLLPIMCQSDVDSLIKLSNRLQVIGDAASRRGIRLLVDAEHTYFQPAIDHLATKLQRLYNRERPIVYNTYQAYLNNCHSRLVIDMKRARRDNFHFAVKLVRGAYMLQERERANRLGYEDPIQPDIESTHAEFHRCIDSLLTADKPTFLMLASHNQQSIEYATRRMHDLAIDKNRVFFGQLLGMADSLTLTLAAHRYRVYKYVPFGPIHEVIPYLLRRAEENSDIGAGCAIDRQIFKHEIKRRLLERLRM